MACDALRLVSLVAKHACAESGAMKWRTVEVALLLAGLAAVSCKARMSGTASGGPPAHGTAPPTLPPVPSGSPPCATVDYTENPPAKAVQTVWAREGCALMDDATVRCGKRTIPPKQRVLHRDVALAAGPCAVSKSGEAYCTFSCRERAPTLDGADRLWGFLDTTCGRVNGSITCHPSNAGNDDMRDAYKKLALERDVVDFAMDEHTNGVLVVKGDGSLEVVRDKRGDFTPSPPLTGVAGVRMAWTSPVACALMNDRRVACWGLGNLDTGRKRGAVVFVPGIDDAVQLEVIEKYSCVRRATGSIWCWSVDNGGRDELKPYELSAANPNLVDFTIGPPCRVLSDGTMHCGHFDNGPSKGSKVLVAPLPLYTE
jgi:hypothetical protein